ncbi:hypothetical protein HMPREF1351_01248 [Enterococcus faecium 510]|nr:hypothetical protein HMPREF1351_01248 [Enterococcus faecium 510]
MNRFIFNIALFLKIATHFFKTLSKGGGFFMTFEKLFYLMVFCEFFLFHPFEVLLSNGIISLSYQMGEVF